MSPVGSPSISDHTHPDSEIYDPFSTETFEDPYPTYQTLRDRCPVYHNLELDFWAVALADDIQAVLQDHAAFSNTGGVDLDGGDLMFGEGNFLVQDPPQHDVLRKVVQQAFSARTVTTLAAYVAGEVDSLLGEIEEKRRFDFVETVSGRLPMRVVSHILGVPREDQQQLARWLGRLFSREAGTTSAPEEAFAAREEFAAYFLDLAAERRKGPRDDVLSAIARATIDGDGIDDDLLVGLLLLLFAAGSETVSNLLSNSVWNLAHDEQQLDLLYRNEVDPRSAVEELVRFDSPIQTTMRTVIAPTQVRGKMLVPGTRVLLLIGSANRDESRFTGAEVLDLRRPPRRHMGFGYGIHFCLGAPLARLQASLFLEAIVSRGLRFHPDGTHERRTKVDSRGFQRLDVRID
jgi:cytochrome P450